MVDITDFAKKILEAVQDITEKDNRLTLGLLTNIYKGNRLKKIRESGLVEHPLFGHGKLWDRTDIERLLHYMVLEKYLQEYINVYYGVACVYVKVGPKASELGRKDVKLVIGFRNPSMARSKRKMPIVDSTADSTKKYKRDDSSAWRGKGSSKSSTKCNPTVKKEIGLASFSQAKQYLAIQTRKSKQIL